MAFTFGSSGYSGAGQTSSSFLSQHHQRFISKPNKPFILAIPLKLNPFVTDSQ
jgi:hypothetical protein